jgi:Tfp pilus assembly protein PilO
MTRGRTDDERIPRTYPGLRRPQVARPGAAPRARGRSDRGELRRLRAALPEREDVDGLLKEITRIAQQVDLAVRTVKGDRPVAAGAAMEVPLSLVLEGSFDALYDFLLALEALPRITRIQSMKVAAIGSDPHAIAGRRGAPGSAGVRAELGLSVYFSAPRAAPSGADASATASTRGGAR